MRILVDVDGVCADIVRAVRLEPESCLDYDFRHLEAKKQEEIERLFQVPLFWRHLPSIPMFGAYIRELELENHEIYFVTAPFFGEKEWCYQRFMWLKERLDIKYEQLIITGSKHLVQGDVFIDDKLSNLVQYRKHNPHSMVVRFGNYAYADAWDGLHAQDWADVLTFVRTREALACL